MTPDLFYQMHTGENVKLNGLLKPVMTCNK